MVRAFIRGAMGRPIDPSWVGPVVLVQKCGAKALKIISSIFQKEIVFKK